MPLQFTVLASGSAANASLLNADGRGVLIDVGLGPRQLASRLAAVGASWSRVQAVLLTHTHTDHWNEPTLAHLHRLGIPFYCHPEHHATLRAGSSAFARLCGDGLARAYEVNEEMEPVGGLRCRPFQVCHDGGLTCGFRFDAQLDFFGQPCALGYAADLGCWEMPQVRALADVDVLALEFNHDVQMERASRRSPQLIARVLGDHGHLSNAQAAALVREVVRHSEAGRLQHVVQLHLSRDCNRPNLALQAAQEVLADHKLQICIHTAHQDRPLPGVSVGEPGEAPKSPRSRTRRVAARTCIDCGFVQAWLPEFE
jgi:phosphoribosyl 1,2-cyclic phosphodiesterase